MHDDWTDRLSEYLDGELSVADQAALEEHLVECDDCRVTLGELRAVVAAARAVENRQPERDLWPGIAAAIDSRAGAGIVPLRPPRSRRRISFTVPQLAAAALLLMAGSGAAVWFLSGAAGARAGAPVSGAIVHAAAAEPAGDGLLVATIPPDPEFEATVAQLERTLELRRAELDPSTVEVLERSMETIDNAIADARAALGADPGNPYLRRQLESTMRRKVDVLRRANGIRRAGA